MTSEEEIREVISTFVCDKDKEIERFLKDNALRFEIKGKSRTYLIIDEELLQRKKEFKIYGYFSLALQVLKVPDTLSNSKVKELDGIYIKRHNEKIVEFPVYLIGQLAKNSTYEKQIDGKELVEYAMAIIYKSYEATGGRIVLVECANQPNLIEFYKSNGFNLIRQDEDGLIQLIRMIKN